MRRFSALVATVAALGGCGGDHERDVLEDVLSADGVSFCNGGCRDYESADADCAPTGVTHAGRTYYDCIVTYRGTDYTDRVCAALAADTTSGYIARDDCPPRGDPD